jgi:hypothetical protein
MSRSDTRRPVTNRPASPGPLSLKWAVLAGLGLGVVTVILTGGSAPGAFDATTIVPASRWEEMTGEYRSVRFDLLAGFAYGEPRGAVGIDLSGDGAREIVPAEVSALSGRRVSVSGFMLPLDFDGEGVTEFLLNANYDMCYFGAPTRANDFIVVRMRDGRRTRFVHTPVIVFGTLEVGEERKGDRVVSLYRMTGDAIGIGAVP